MSWVAYEQQESISYGSKSGKSKIKVPGDLVPAECSLVFTHVPLTSWKGLPVSLGLFYKAADPFQEGRGFGLGEGTNIQPKAVPEWVSQSALLWVTSSIVSPLQFNVIRHGPKPSSLSKPHRKLFPVLPLFLLLAASS